MIVDYEEVKKITQCNKDNFRTLENIEFAAVGMLEKKLANIFLYIKNNKLTDNAIFLSESQKKEVSSLKKKIKIVNAQINDENFLKCIDILNRINYVKNTKELQKLHQANIKTFNHLECPTINTATVQNKHTTLLEFLSLTNELNNLQSAIINKFEDELETATIDKLENKSNPFL